MARLALASVVACSSGPSPHFQDAAGDAADAPSGYGDASPDARCGTLAYSIIATLDQRTMTGFDSPIRDLFGHTVELQVETATATVAHRMSSGVWATTVQATDYHLILRTDAVVQASALALRDAVTSATSAWDNATLLAIGHFDNNRGDLVVSNRIDNPNDSRFVVGISCSDAWPHFDAAQFPLVTNTEVVCELRIDDEKAPATTGGTTAARVSGTGQLRLRVGCAL